MSSPTMSNTTKPTPTSLSNSQQTLLITLYGRHLDSLSPHPILADPFSSLVIQRINYDFPTLAAGNGTQVVVSTRSRHFDERISSFLAHCKEKGDDVTVVQLGCGLDTRSHRVQWGGQGVRWIDVDLPEVIALRRAAMPDLPPAPDGKKREYSTVSGSATEEGLIKGLPNDGVTLVVMEGLAAYLDPDEGRRMVGVVCEHFGKRGGEVLVDTAGRLTGWISGVFGYIWRVKGRVGWVRWAVDPGELERLHGGLRLVEADSWSTMETRGRFGWPMRGLMRALSWFEAGRNTFVWCRLELRPKRDVEE